MNSTLEDTLRNNIQEVERVRGKAFHVEIKFRLRSLKYNGEGKGRFRG